jgi:hypothetical protein
MDWVSVGLGYKVKMYMQNPFKKYKYDVAISVAHEEVHIAQQIAAALKGLGITYFLYTEQRAQNWGEHILKISLDKYGAEAKYVMLIISSIYVEKYWANIENQISQIYVKRGEIYILPLRLDDTPVDGLSKHIVFEKWNNNPNEIATFVADKLRLRNKRKPALLLIIIALLFGASVTYYLFSQNNNTGKIVIPVEDAMEGVFGGLKESVSPFKNSDSANGHNNRMTSPGEKQVDTHKVDKTTQLPIVQKQLSDNSKMLAVSGLVVDEITKHPIDSALVIVNDKIAYTKNGAFEIKLDIDGRSMPIAAKITKDGYLDHTDNRIIVDAFSKNVFRFNSIPLTKN